MRTIIKITLWVVGILAYSGWTYMVGTNAPPSLSKFEAWVTAPIGLLLYLATVILILIALIILPFAIIDRWRR